MKQLKKAIKGYAETKQAIDELTAQLKAYRAIIEAEMDARQTDAITSGKLTAKRSVSEQRRFDSKAFKADYAAVYENYRRPVEISHFTVSA